MHEQHKAIASVALLCNVKCFVTATSATEPLLGLNLPPAMCHQDECSIMLHRWSVRQQKTVHPDVLSESAGLQGNQQAVAKAAEAAVKEAKLSRTFCQLRLTNSPSAASQHATAVQSVYRFHHAALHTYSRLRVLFTRRSTQHQL